MAKQQLKTKKIKTKYYEGVGRRRQAVARVRIYPLNKNKKLIINEHELKKGKILVNNHLIKDYFSGKINEFYYLEPLKATNSLNSFAISVKIVGGGKKGQLEAFVHGLSRALEKFDKEKYRPILKKRGFLTRDARTKERRKAGLAQKARAKKQSPKR